jgi:hypothetical protein
VGTSFAFSRLASAQFAQNPTKENAMLELATITMPVAAAGWAFLYMLCGGGLGGAILIFLGLKAIGK